MRRVGDRARPESWRPQWRYGRWRRRLARRRWWRHRRHLARRRRHLARRRRQLAWRKQLAWRREQLARRQLARWLLEQWPLVRQRELRTRLPVLLGLAVLLPGLLRALLFRARIRADVFVLSGAERRLSGLTERRSTTLSAILTAASGTAAGTSGALSWPVLLSRYRLLPDGSGVSEGVAPRRP